MSKLAVAMSHVMSDRGSTEHELSADKPVEVALVASWVVFVLAGLSLLKVLSPQTFGWAVPLAALFVVRFEWDYPPPGVRWGAWKPDTRDFLVIVILFLVATGGLRSAFMVAPTERGGTMLLTVAGALLVGVAGPVTYTVWHRHRSLATLGITGDRLSLTAALATAFGIVQFLMTLNHRSLPAPGRWVPLLALSLTVGLFESVFFFGFIQGRLEEALGALPAAFCAAGLFALSHYGYHLPSGDLVVMFGFGVLFAIAYRLARNILVLWPLLTPAADFYSYLRSGVQTMPWVSLAAFTDVLLVMAVILTVSTRPGRIPDGT
jgi:uncharacterized protein